MNDYLNMIFGLAVLTFPEPGCEWVGHEAEKPIRTKEGFPQQPVKPHP